MLSHTQINVDLGRVQTNAKAVAVSVRSPVWATIKADAYGLGAARIAATLGDLVEGFCVFALEEATQIDLWRLTGRAAIALGPPSTLDPGPWIEAHVRPAVSNPTQAKALAAARPLLCVDTGMQRFACPPEDIDAAIEAGNIDEAFTHATRPEHAARLVELMSGRSMRLHAAASSLLTDPSTHLDAVRPGLALYEGAVTVSTPLVEIRQSRGPIGYSGWTSATGWHGVLPVGYSQGLRPGPVVIDGRRQRIMEVGMQSAYVTVLPSDRVGERVVLLGEGIGERELSQAWGCTPHQALVQMCQIGNAR